MNASKYIRPLVALVVAVVGCRQLLGIEDATLICPPGLPSCTTCQDADDCGPPPECATWSCEANVCTPVGKPELTPCAKGVCVNDPLPVCVTCKLDEQCPADAHCATDHTCYRCDDGVKNGDENGIDCDGECKRCLGTPCYKDEECKSGFCADGHCCTSRCDQPCATCNNFEGNCSDMPQYYQDDKPSCEGQKVCNGSGLCLLRPGEICMSAVNCASGRCYKLRCAKLPGEDCTDPIECAEMSCVNGVCQQ
jgi:hypothetical protein